MLLSPQYFENAIANTLPLTVKEIEKERKIRQDTSDRDISLLIYTQARNMTLSPN